MREERRQKRMLFWYVHIFLCIKTMTHRSNIVHWCLFIVIKAASSSLSSLLFRSGRAISPPSLTSRLVLTFKALLISDFYQRLMNGIFIFMVTALWLSLSCQCSDGAFDADGTKLNQQVKQGYRSANPQRQRRNDANQSVEQHVKPRHHWAAMMFVKQLNLVGSNCMSEICLRSHRRCKKYQFCMIVKEIFWHKDKIEETDNAFFL